MKHQSRDLTVSAGSSLGVGLLGSLRESKQSKELTEDNTAPPGLTETHKSGTTQLDPKSLRPT